MCSIILGQDGWGHMIIGRDNDQVRKKDDCAHWMQLKSLGWACKVDNNNGDKELLCWPLLRTD